MSGICLNCEREILDLIIEVDVAINSWMVCIFNEDLIVSF